MFICKSASYIIIYKERDIHLLYSHHLIYAVIIYLILLLLSLNYLYFINYN